MNKHTPGPWNAEIKGRIITSERTICIQPQGESFDSKETEANAQLIAAAPDLLEALEDMLELCECQKSIILTGPDSWPSIRKAKKTIAKAKGES